jgi:hypothetical protein
MHVLQTRRRKKDKPENEKKINLMLRCGKGEKFRM